MPGPHHRAREYAGTGAVAAVLAETTDWSQLEPLPAPSKRSGLTSSDDAPRYRRGSKRRPKPPKTVPGLVQGLHRSMNIAHFNGKGRGYAAVDTIPPSVMLFQERPFQIVGSFQNAQGARRELARRVALDDRYKHLHAGDDGGTQNGSVSSSSDNKTSHEPSPYPEEGIDDATWNETLKRVTKNAHVRVAKKSESNLVESINVASNGNDGDTNMNGTANDGDALGNTISTQYVARLFAHVSTCNHSCVPNAAVSVSDQIVTVYSMRQIEKGEEITVAYGANLLWLPVDCRRKQLARVWGFFCKCDRCAVELQNAIDERDRASGMRANQASRHGHKPQNPNLFFDSHLNKKNEKLAGFSTWEFGETGFENQFDDEGRLLGGGSVGKQSDKLRTERGDSRSTDTSDTESSSSSSTSSLSDSSDDHNYVRSLNVSKQTEGSGGGRQSVSTTKKHNRSSNGYTKESKVLGAHRLYNKLVKAGIGPDHWQMHAVREQLVSKLLSAEGRKDFDLDLLLEHANCASRLAPNHPHFVRLVTLVEEVFKSNKNVVQAEQFWVWIIELLREAVHPDVLFWNTEFKGMPGERMEGGSSGA